MHRVIFYLKFSLLFIWLAILTACSSTPLSAREVAPYYIASIDIASNAKQRDIETQYGAKAVVFKPEAGFAVLGFSKEAGELSSLNVDPNLNAISSPEVNAQGVSAWAGGFSAWAGGFSAWAGGWSAWSGGWSAWSGGNLTLPTLAIENRALWHQVRLPQAQALSKNFGHNIKVAVIDTGIDVLHPMFLGRLAPLNEWKDFVDDDNNPQEVSGGSSYGHGTGVAGLILQVAPRATILPLRVLDANGHGDTDDVISAIDWAMQKGAQVINLSLGANSSVAALKSMVSYANSQGVFVISSAGNNGTTSMTYPAADAQSAPYSDKLFSVGSITSSGTRSAFSSYGSALKFSAPGENISSAYPGNKSAQYTGTSFAAPVLAGAITLALSDNASNTWNSMSFYLANSSFGSGSTGSIFGTFDIASLLQKFPDSPRRKALFVTGSSTLNANDHAIKTRLEAIGYTVTAKRYSSANKDLTKGMDLLLISSSASATAISSEYADVKVPVVTWQEGIYKDMKMTNSKSSDVGSSSSLSQIKLVNTGHPLAAGLSGNVTIYQSNNEVAWGKPGTNAIQLASLSSDSSKLSIFAYDKNVSMVGLTAPARRVGMFMNDTGSSLTKEGWQLFEAAVTWAVTGN